MQSTVKAGTTTKSDQKSRSLVSGVFGGLAALLGLALTTTSLTKNVLQSLPLPCWAAYPASMHKYFVEDILGFQGGGIASESYWAPIIEALLLSAFILMNASAVTRGGIIFSWVDRLGHRLGLLKAHDDPIDASGEDLINTPIFQLKVYRAAAELSNPIYLSLCLFLIGFVFSVSASRAMVQPGQQLSLFTYLGQVLPMTFLSIAWTIAQAALLIATAALLVAAAAAFIALMALAGVLFFFYVMIVDTILDFLFLWSFSYDLWKLWLSGFRNGFAFMWDSIPFVVTNLAAALKGAVPAAFICFAFALGVVYGHLRFMFRIACCVGIMFVALVVGQFVPCSSFGEVSLPIKP